MATMENSNFFFDYPLIDERDIAVGAADFSASGSDGGYFWNPQGINCPSNASVENSVSFVDSADLKESNSKKRVRPESSSVPGSKACREKMRRDRLNDRFLELGSILEPGKPPKMDKLAILSDALRMVTQLRSEAEKLKDSNENLEEKIKELKVEKNELRDEKQRLKAEKETLEMQIKMMNSQSSLIMPHHPRAVMPTTPFGAGQGQAAAAAAGQKLMMPVIGYHGFPMWQFMPPADVDTSQDAESCPPVA